MSRSNLDIERYNIFRAIEFGFMLPSQEMQTVRHVLIDLLRETSHFMKQRGYWLEWLQTLERIAERNKVEDAQLQCKLFNQLGDLYRLTQQFPKAIKAHKKAETLARQSNDEVELGHIYFYLGMVHLRNREHKQAEDFGQKSLNIFSRHKPDRKEMAGVLNLLGLAARSRNDLETAESRLRRSINLRLRTNQPVDLARTLNNLAIVLQEQEKWKEALHYFAEAKQTLETTDSELDRVMVALSEGTLFFRMGQYVQARETFEKIDMPFLEQSGHLLYQALATNNLGAVFISLEQFDEAETCLRESIEYCRKIGDDLRLAKTLAALSEALTKQGNKQAALDTIDEANALLTKLPAGSEGERLYKDLVEQKEKVSKN